MRSSLSEVEENDKKLAQDTQRIAMFLWLGLIFAMTLFYVQSQIVFVKGSPLPSNPLEWVLVFLGALTFLFGFYFFKNYTRVRSKEIRSARPKDRKQSLLIAFVFQFVLFETLGLYGVLISVLTQNSLKALPFIAAAYIGFFLSFPKKRIIDPFFIRSR